VAIKLAVAAVVVCVSCKPLVAAVPPAIADVACILADAEKGSSISQIVVDCGGDTAQVISALTSPENYSRVNGSQAYAEAGRVKLALSRTP
jgi:hypothetical protein